MEPDEGERGDEKDKQIEKEILKEIESNRKRRGGKKNMRKRKRGTK